MPQVPGGRSVVLGEGGSLVVRPVEPRDAEGLTALYAGLDDESRYRRFFSLYRPDAAFIERMIAAEERQAVCLVAVAVGRDDGSTERIVGEAGYEILPNGDGELAITIDASWRGWLGPFLLDALVEAAAAHGVPDLEADVLTTNRPMLAILRARGHVAMAAGDWTVARWKIGARSSEPTPEPAADATVPASQRGHGR
jgi:acetyltransferase